MKGCKGVMKILLELDEVDPNQLCEHRQTLLGWAASKGLQVVKILLGQDDINPDKLNPCDQTPLWCTAENRDEEVAEILLGRDDVNPDKPDKYNTAKHRSHVLLRWARENGRNATQAK